VHIINYHQVDIRMYIDANLIISFCDQVYIKFVRMGAKFDAKTKAEYADIQGKSNDSFGFGSSKLYGMGSNF
jgi:hypothetical protein